MMDSHHTHHRPIPALGWISLLSVLFFLSLLATPASAVPANAYDEKGLPFLTVYYPDDYNGMGQNWDIVQDSRGMMYLANGDGVFEFDGVKWRWLEPGINRTARSLDAGPGNHIYVGYHNEMGYYHPDSTGQMTYTSLSPELPESIGRFRDVWSTIVTDEYVFFSSLSHIFRWQITAEGPVTGSLSMIMAPEAGRFQGLRVVNGRVLVISTTEGVRELVDDQLVTLPGTETMNLRPVWSILPRGDDELLLLGYEGIFRYDGKRVRPWDTPVSDLARKTEAYSASSLGDGFYALGTDNEGLVLFNDDGEVLRVINRDHGLPNNQVFNYPYLDREGGVWLCLDYGIARVELLNGLQRYDHTLGLRGGVLALERFGDTLVIGTSQGLFVPDPPKGLGLPVTFSSIDSVLSVWSLGQLDGHLVIADENDVRVTRSLASPPSAVLRDVGPMCVTVDSAHSRALIGCAAGRVYSITHRNGRWRSEGLIANLFEDINWLSFAPDGALWATFGFDTLRYARLELDDSSAPPKVRSSKIFSPANGYLEAVPGSPFLWDGEWMVSAWKGLYRWNTELDSLVLATDHPLYPLASGMTINLPTVGRKNHLWFENQEGVGQLAILREDGGIDLHSPLRRTPNTGYNMFTVENGTLWAGMVGLHLLRFDLSALDHSPPPPAGMLIRSVLADDTPIHRGAVSQLDFRKQPLPYQKNKVRIEFALPAFDDISRNIYQTRLIGLDDRWADWSDDTYQQFNNLPPNLYRFEVRGRDVNGRVSEPAWISFRIDPPWYATWWAILFWIALSAGTGYAIVRWRISTIEQRNLKLDQLVRQRTEELDRVRLAEQEAEIKASQMETAYKMAATIAHEFNNPLAIIHASSQLMQKHEFDEDRLRELANKIPPQVIRLRDLLQRILTVEELKEIDYAAGMTILDIHGRRKQEEAEKQAQESATVTATASGKPDDPDSPATSPREDKNRNGKPASE